MTELKETRGFDQVGDEWQVIEFYPGDPDCSDGFYHVYCVTKGTSINAAKVGATSVINELAKGKTTFIRIAPEAKLQKLFSGKAEYLGYVRFSYKDEKGDWSYLAKIEGSNFGFSVLHNGKD